MRINLKLITGLLALVLWIYVNIIISPPIRRNVSTKVEYRNVPKLMRVTPEKAMAEVTLAGTRRDFIIAGRDMVQLTVDLYELRPGNAMLPLKVTTPPGLTVVSIKPAQMEVTGERLVSEKFDVSVEVKGQTDEGFLAEMPNLTPKHVTVEGPEELVKRIASSKVTISLNNARNSVSESLPISLLATSGEVIEGVKVIPEKVNVDITVKDGYPARIVRVKPQFINKTQEGFRLEGYDVIPPEVSITGPGRIIEQTGELLTMPIDLASMKSSSSITALLKPPVETVRVIGSGTVTIGVRVVATEITKHLDGMPLTVERSSNQHCMTSTASYTVILRGFAEQFERASRAEIKAVLDIRKMAPGSYTVPLPCLTGVPDGIEVVEVQPETVQIDITEIVHDAPPAEGSQ